MKLIYLLLFVFIFISGHLYAGKKHSMSNILVINSYSPTQDRINKVLPAYLDQMDLVPDVNISVEYLCCKQLTNFHQWTSWLTNKLDSYYTYPDIVVILGQEAWFTYRVVCPNDWKQIPIILGNTTLECIDYRQYSDTLTNTSKVHSIKKSFDDYKVKGYFYYKYIYQNIQLIHDLQPNVKRISILSDNPFGLKIDKSYLSSVKIPNLYINNLNNDNSSDEISDQIKRYPTNNAILCNGYENDINTNTPNNCYKIRNEICKLEHNVIYSLSDCDFHNSSVLGGYFVSGKDLGKDLATLTEDMLEYGYDECPQFESTPSKPQYYINTYALAKIGLSESNSILMNMTLVNSYSNKLFEHYQVFSISILLSIIFFIVVILIFAFMRRKYHQLAYDYNQQLDKYTSTIPDMTIIIESDYKIRNIHNSLTCINNYCNPNDLIGHSLDIALGNIVHFSFLEDIKRNIDFVIQRQETLTGIYAIIFPKQKKKYIQYTIAPFHKNSIICYQRNATQHMRSKLRKDEIQKIMQNILNHIPMSISVKNVENNYRYVLCNRKFIQTQAFFENIIGKNDFELNNANAKEEHEKEVQIVQNNSTDPVLIRNIVYNEQREPLWEEVTQKFLYTNQEKKYIISICQNSTPDNRNKYELQYLKKELYMALKAGMFFTWIYNINNKTFKTTHFSNRFSITLEHLYKNISQEDQIKVNEILHNIEIGLKKHGDLVLKYQHNNHYDWYKFYFYAILGKQAQGVEQIVIVSQDISEEMRKILDLEYRKTSVMTVLNCSGFTAWEYNILTKEFSSDSPLSIFYGRMTEKTYLSHVHPDDQHLIQEMLSNLILENISFSNILVRHISSSQNKYQWIEINATRLRSSFFSETCKTGIIGTIRDVTDCIEDRQALSSLQKQIQECNENKYTLVNKICQDLRSPLNSILEFSSLLIENKDMNNRDEFIRIIYENHQTIMLILNNLLDITNLKTGKMDFHSTSFQINDIINYMIQAYSLKIANNIQLSTSMPAIVCSIYCDKARLSQVISAFLDYITSHIKEGSILIGYRYNLSDITIFVKAKAYKNNLTGVLFEDTDFSFYADNSNLELSICQKIIEQMGGQVGFKNANEANESEFFINLPANIMKSN